MAGVSMRSGNVTRLYYDDVETSEFDARVLACERRGEQFAVLLDRTAFYPTGGGQPHDTGVMGAVRVDGVETEDGNIWHVTREPLEVGLIVHAVLDWPRRLDHMQQHTGQHILSEAFIRACEANTVAFHLGETESTIDLDRTGLTQTQVAETEEIANAAIDAALPVDARFVDPSELATLPLRRPPKVSEDVRVVRVGEFDYSACGGTHVSNSARVGLIKVTALERRGDESRVTFLCGGRARAHYAETLGIVQGLVGYLTTAPAALLPAIQHRDEEAQAVRRELARLELEWAAATAGALWGNAETIGAGRVVAALLPAPAERVRRIAQELRSQPAAVVLLASGGHKPQLFFTHADGVDLDAAALLKAALSEVGGRGGGRPDWAQGGAANESAADRALQFARMRTHALLGS